MDRKQSILYAIKNTKPEYWRKYLRENCRIVHALNPFPDTDGEVKIPALMLYHKPTREYHEIFPSYDERGIDLGRAVKVKYDEKGRLVIRDRDWSAYRYYQPARKTHYPEDYNLVIIRIENIKSSYRYVGKDHNIAVFPKKLSPALLKNFWRNFKPISIPKEQIETELGSLWDDILCLVDVNTDISRMTFVRANNKKPIVSLRKQNEESGLQIIDTKKEDFVSLSDYTPLNMFKHVLDLCDTAIFPSIVRPSAKDRKMDYIVLHRSKPELNKATGTSSHEKMSTLAKATKRKPEDFKSLYKLWKYSHITT